MEQVNNSITLKAIQEILSDQFLIPSYQRGYRWEKLQVTTLLDDIQEFENKEKKKDEIYCLQPVVVRKNRTSWEVIDGQQRLTTIFILLKYIHRILNYNLKIFNISYESRTTSESFLENVDNTPDDSNIDYHHMSQAYIAIAGWFEEKSNSLLTATKIYPVLLEKVKIIWYQLADDQQTDPIDVFTRLNLGKIPLTDAELIKALLLKSENFSSADAESKSNKRIQLRQLIIANQWDQIEYALQDKGFWYFLTNEHPKDGPKISFILDLVAGNKGKSDVYHTFRYFNAELEKRKDQSLNDRVVNLWQSIYGCYQSLQEWYSERDLYHLIGFLLAVPSGTRAYRNDYSIRSLQEKSSVYTKTEFKEYLKECISNIVEGNIAELDYDNREKVRVVLLMFNIQSLLLNDRSNARFQFDRFKSEYWDIEHIHAVRSRLPENLAQQKEWIEVLIQEAGDELSPELTSRATRFLAMDLNQSKMEFEPLANEIISLFDDDLNTANLDGIGNLTLLDMATNRSYKNAIFPVKREKIIRQDEKGSFIPICTKNVFLKYYTHMPEQLTVWTKHDMEAYRNKIAATLSEYRVS